MKAVRVAALTLVLLSLFLFAASPAGAAPVLANERYKWFFWIGPLLMVAGVLFVLALVAGYYLKVLRPKYRGRPTPK